MAKNTITSRCIYCLDNFESANGEHILQNFLGARWTSRAIVCNKHQDDFGKTIDLALEKGLRPVRNMFGTRSGRHEPAPTLQNIQSSDGDFYHFAPGFRPNQKKPVVKLVDLPGGQKAARLQLGNRKQLDWALHILRQQVPGVEIDRAKILADAATVELPKTRYDIRCSFGGSDYFRGMLKSCFNLLAISYPTIAFKPCFEDIRNFVCNGTSDLRQFIRWVDDSKPLKIPRLEEIDQAVFIISRGTSIEGIIQYFGEIVHSFQRERTIERIANNIAIEVLEPYVGRILTPEILDQIATRYAERVLDSVNLIPMSDG